MRDGRGLEKQGEERGKRGGRVMREGWEWGEDREEYQGYIVMLRH